MPECDLAAGQCKAENLRQSVQALGIPHGDSPTADMVTLSIGVAAIIPGTKSTPAELVASADKALYVAKANGRNRISSAPESTTEPS